MPGVKDGGALQARCTKRILGYSLRELKVLYAINIEYKNIFFRKKKLVLNCIYLPPPMFLYVVS